MSAREHGHEGQRHDRRRTGILISRRSVERGEDHEGDQVERQRSRVARAAAAATRARGRHADQADIEQRRPCVSARPSLLTRQAWLRRARLTAPGAGSSTGTSSSRTLSTGTSSTVLRPRDFSPLVLRPPVLRPPILRPTILRPAVFLPRPLFPFVVVAVREELLAVADVRRVGGAPRVLPRRQGSRDVHGAGALLEAAGSGHGVGRAHETDLDVVRAECSGPPRSSARRRRPRPAPTCWCRRASGSWTPSSSERSERS